MNSHMQLQQIAYALVLMLAFGAYWWWRSRGRGGRQTEVYLGLSPGEELETYASGRHHLDFGVADVGAAALGMERVGKNVTLAKTRQGSLILRTEGAPPLRLQPGQLRVRCIKENVESRAGFAGTAEPADIIELSVEGNGVQHLVFARSVCNALAQLSAR
ncbi:MAG: hypothetical protein BWY17_02578 [Deltaproteobacteria bacterium ADurb.Bin207]|nr:MAG: hypothetical protein BWY17_02578 [Deltaproteobacteria bacterium ADurb.Bin207]